MRLLLITGLSGAGKTSTLKAVEDLGYETIDNLPVRLLSPMLDVVSPGEAIAVGVDMRTRGFAVDPMRDELARILAHPDMSVALVFLDCDDEVLRKRFTETRRRHPLAADRPVVDGIRHERRLLEPLRELADTVIDTTDMTAADLRRHIGEHYSLSLSPGLSVSVISFAFRNGLPREADLVFDVRFLANPHYDPALRPGSGLDEAVGSYIAADPGFTPFFERLSALLMPLLPAYEREGKSYLTIAVGCTGGRHRSVYVAERLGQELRQEGHRVTVRHRDLAEGDRGDR